MNRLARFASLFVLASCIDTTPQGDPVGHSNWTFDEYVASLPTDGRGGYIVEGDVVTSNPEVLEAAYGRSLETALIVDANTAGVDIKYTKTEALNLTYCVGDSTVVLPADKWSAAEKKLVVDALALATQAWADATKIATGDAPTVKFTYVPTEDATCGPANGNVYFNVIPYVPVAPDTNYNRYYALAFFPREARAKRQVQISRAGISGVNKQTLEGLMLHELGHVLGFMHEHIKMPSTPCPETDTTYRQVTPYEVTSVMHYRDISTGNCGTSGSTAWTLTTNDNAGVRCLYTTQSRAAADTAADACRVLTSLSSTAATQFATDVNGRVYRLTQSTANGVVTSTLAQYVPATNLAAQKWSTLWSAGEPAATATTGIFVGGSRIYRRTVGSLYVWNGTAWGAALAGTAGSSAVASYTSGDLFRLNGNGTIDRFVGQAAPTALLTATAAGRKLFAGNTGVFRLESNGDLYSWSVAGGWTARIGTGIQAAAQTGTGNTFALLTGAAGQVMQLGGSGAWTAIGSGASAIWGGLEVPYMSRLDVPTTISRNASGTTWYKYALNSTTMMKGGPLRRIAVNTNGRLYGYVTPTSGL